MKSPVKAAGEYLEFVKRGIQNADKIIEAIKISAQVKDGREEVSPEEVAEILRRKDICKGCPYFSENMKNYVAPAGVNYTHCSLCWCRIGYEDSKEYCLSCTCGAADWNKRNPQNQLPVQWSAVRTPKPK